MNGCDCWGPESCLDTKIDKFDLCHILMSYASFGDFSPLYILKIFCIFYRIWIKKRARKMAPANKKFYVSGISEQK